MLSRRQLQRELVEVSERAASIMDHIARAAKAHDTITIQDLLPPLRDEELRIDEITFQLDLINEVSNYVAND